MRLFVAVDIPEDVRAAIGKLVEDLRPVSPTARWVRIAGLHVTLKFIGHIPDEKLEQIRLALASVAFPAAISVKFRGVGFFPNERRPRVLWVGIEASAGLGALAAAVESALEPLGIAREQRAFSPHLTLARFESPKGLAPLQGAIAVAGPLEFGNAIVEQFHLYQSILKPGGAEYTRLATFKESASK